MAKKTATKKTTGKAKKTPRWTGYERTPGTVEGTKGSWRPKGKK